MNPLENPPPAARNAPPANAVCDASGIDTADLDNEGVAQRALTSLPTRVVVETTQTAAEDPATREAVEGEAIQRARGHYMPRQCTEAELLAEDLQLQRLTDADRRLISVYGDTIHQNDGTHLD